jgi:hypothetical protein
MPKEKTHWKKSTGILIALAMLACRPIWSQNEGTVPSSHASKALNISLDSLLEILKKYSGDEDAQAMTIGLIRIYGLGFRPTPQDMERLRAASASVTLLKAIETAKLPPPKPLPKHGLLAVSCEPVDCDVSLDGRSVGSTSHGHLPWISHVEGPVSVSATKANYEATQQGMEANIRPDELTQIAFHLKLTRARLLEIGAQRFQQMLQSIRPHSESNGNDAASRPITQNDGDALRAAGTLYLHGPDGRCVVWSVVAWFGKGRSDRFELSRLREKHILISTETGYSWDHAFGSSDARELEGGLRLLVAGQLPELMERLSVPDLTMIAPDSGETFPEFRIEGKSLDYSVVLDSAYRPNKITMETSDALSAHTILYSDYVQIGDGFYPKTAQVMLPDGVSGIEARFDTVQIAAMPAGHPKRHGIFR